MRVAAARAAPVAALAAEAELGATAAAAVERAGTAGLAAPAARERSVVPRRSPPKKWPECGP